MKPTQLHVASSPEAVALAEANASNRVFLESDFKAANGKLPWLPAWELEQGYLRIGDAPVNLEAMVGYSHDNEYRLIVPRISHHGGDLLRTDENDRQGAPARAGWHRPAHRQLQRAQLLHQPLQRGGALNVLCAGSGGRGQRQGCNRGAKSLEEFQLQRAKIVNAITEMDADLLGLMEMENNGFSTSTPPSTIWWRASTPGRRRRASTTPSSPCPRPCSRRIDLWRRRHHGGHDHRPPCSPRAGMPTSSPAPAALHHGRRHQERRSAGLPGPALHRGGSDAPDPGGQPPQVQGVGLAKTGWQDGACGSAGQVHRVSGERRQGAGGGGEQDAGAGAAGGDFNSYAKGGSHPGADRLCAGRGERQIRSASHTYIGDKPYEQMGQTVAKGYGLVDLNVKFNREKAISYSYEAELGTLDYALANPALADKGGGGGRLAHQLLREQPVRIWQRPPAISSSRTTPSAPRTTTQSSSTSGSRKRAGGGGAMGVLLLALLPLAWRRRHG